MKFKKFFSLALVVCMTVVTAAGCSGTTSTNNNKTTTETTVKPGDATLRNETLYIDGLQWGAPANFNPLHSNPASFPAASGSVARELLYETLYMYNQLDGKMYPLLTGADVELGNHV